VNDAPALKAADIGVALGSGTEVAKQASDMVLLDDNLSSVTAAIEQGRVIFDNIRRSVVYLLASGFTEMVLIAGALVFGLPLPLLPGHILWINLVADTLPNVALAMECGEPDLMRVPPRPRGEPVLNRRMAVLLFTIGVTADLFLFVLYLWALSTKEAAAAQSFMFAAVGVASLAYVFAVRSFRRPVFRLSPFSNPWLVAAVGIGVGLLVLAIHHPWFGAVLRTVPLSLSDWGLLAMIGIIKLGAIEAAKPYVV
jgi:Ca2+-transporting ATPase